MATAKELQGLQATYQALLDCRAELVARAVRDEAACAYVAAQLEIVGDRNAVWGSAEWRALLDAYRATTPSATPASHTIVSRERLQYLEQVEAVARTLREPYQPGGPSAEFVVLRRLLGGAS